MLTKSYYQSPLGQMLFVSDKEALLGLWFVDQKYFGAGFTLNEIPQHTTSLSRKVTHWLDRYFNQEVPSLTGLPLNPQVTDYRQEVLQVLKEVPYGQVVTYGDLSQKLQAKGRQTSPRAVGGAVGHNPISILIPCHRVIGTDGSLTGYAGGLERKIALLKLEGVEVSHLK